MAIEFLYKCSTSIASGVDEAQLPCTFVQNLCFFSPFYFPFESTNRCSNPQPSFQIPRMTLPHKNSLFFDCHSKSSFAFHNGQKCLTGSKCRGEFIAQENCVKSTKKDRKSQPYLSIHSSSVGIKRDGSVYQSKRSDVYPFIITIFRCEFFFSLPSFICWHCCYFHLILQFRSVSFILCKSFHYALADFGVLGLLRYDSLMCFCLSCPVWLFNRYYSSYSTNVVVGDLYSGAWNIMERNK